MAAVESHHWPSQDFVASNGKSRFIYVMRNAQDRSGWNQAWVFIMALPIEVLPLGGMISFKDCLEGNVENGKWFDHMAGGMLEA
mmetsp:Transcript_22631/g.33588  ORF Transcript_22631/g.33588 Transcript_22631/m.33588 type:complete len:84 (+) Transcript_22631:86-337(+)